MGVIDIVNIKITGSVPGDYNDKDYEVVLTKLQVICAEHGLDLEED